MNRVLIKDATIKIWLGSYIILILSALLGAFIFIFLAVVLVAIYSKVKIKIYGAVFLALLPMLPSELGVVIGGIGINYLFTMYYPLLLVLCILVPLLLSSSFTKINLTDKIMIMYVILLCVLTYRAPNITSSIRDIFIIILTILVPYFSFSLNLKSYEDFEVIAKGMVVMSIFLSAISLYEVIFHWTYFKYLFSRDLFVVPGYYFSQYSRGEYVRAVSSVGAPIPLSYYLVVSLIFGYFLYSVQIFKKSSLYIYSLMIALSIYFTGSRAGVMSIALLAILLIRLSIVSRSKRHFIDASLVLTIIMAFVLWPDINVGDEYGTFQYRVDLIKTSFVIFLDNFLFGSDDYMAGLESLRQGQGIIDIVNTYVRVALSSGMVGLLLFILVFVTIIRALSKIINIPDVKNILYEKKIAKFLLVACIVTSVFIGTVSSVGIIPYLFWSLLGIASAFIKLYAQQTAKNLHG